MDRHALTIPRSVRGPPSSICAALSAHVNRFNMIGGSADRGASEYRAFPQPKCHCRFVCCTERRAIHLPSVGAGRYDLCCSAARIHCCTAAFWTCGLRMWPEPTTNCAVKIGNRMITIWFSRIGYLPAAMRQLDCALREWFRNDNFASQAQRDDQTSDCQYSDVAIRLTHT
jgi:hypothetical protein